MKLTEAVLREIIKAGIYTLWVLVTLIAFAITENSFWLSAAFFGLGGLASSIIIAIVEVVKSNKK